MSSPIDYGSYRKRLVPGVDHWGLIDEFLADWELEGPQTWGFTADEIEAAEKQFGFQLPLALKQWYALGSRPLRLWGRHTHQVLPDYLDAESIFEVYGGYLPFQEETQTCCQWGIRTGVILA